MLAGECASPGGVKGTGEPAGDGAGEVSTRGAVRVLDFKVGFDRRSAKGPTAFMVGCSSLVT